MRQAVEGASEGDVAERIGAALADFEQDSALGDAIFVPMILADMAGQLMVIEHEAAPPAPVQMAVGDGQAPGAFLNLPWDEAIQEFKARGIIQESEFTALLRDYANRSQEARQLMLEQLRKRTEELVVQALERGETLKQFADNFDQVADDLGITAKNPAYINTVFRTNVQSAYGAGRYRKLTDPTLAEERPFVQYRTAGDSRVREAHAALDGLVFRIDDPEWQRIAPPNGFNCRCSMVTLSAEEAQQEGGVSGGIPEDGQPDPEFDGPPVKLVAEPIT